MDYLFVEVHERQGKKLYGLDPIWFVRPGSGTVFGLKLLFAGKIIMNTFNTVDFAVSEYLLDVPVGFMVLYLGKWASS